MFYSRFRYYCPSTGTFISQDPIGLLGNNPNLYAYVSDSNTLVDPFGLKFKEFTQAMFGNKGKNDGALDWLLDHGFKAEEVTLGRFGDIKEKPIGMKTSNGKVGFRVEFDERSGAHINTWACKEKGPHFEFEGTKKSVKKIQRHYIKCK